MVPVVRTGEYVGLLFLFAYTHTKDDLNTLRAAHALPRARDVRPRPSLQHLQAPLALQGAQIDVGHAAYFHIVEG